MDDGGQGALLISRVVLRAHQLKSIGPGQRYLMEREWLSDGRVLQRINEGTPSDDQVLTPPAA